MEIIEEKLPLVSIVVITYNSSKYVIETLESAKAQTYKNIELIISDDCSVDNTVEICKEWLIENKRSFYKSEITITSNNMGIPGNCNNGTRAASGNWIKLIAGDDLLLPNCIKDNLEGVQNLNASFLFSKPIFINNKSIKLQIPEKQKKYNDRGKFYELNAEEQFLHMLIKPNPMDPSTLFFETKAIEKLEGFNEDHIIEDFPLYLKATNAGFKLNFLDQFTVKYRIHDASFSLTVRNRDAVSFWEKINLNKTIKIYITPTLCFKHPLICLEFYNKLIFMRIILLFGNNKNMKRKLRFLRWLSPIIFQQNLIKLKKRMTDSKF